MNPHPSWNASLRPIWIEKRTGVKGAAKRKCSFLVSSKTRNFSEQPRLYSNVFRVDFPGLARGAVALNDFSARFCILEPFCSTEDRCRTGRARIPRMPYLSLFVLPLSSTPASTIYYFICGATFPSLASLAPSLSFGRNPPSLSVRTARRVTVISFHFFHPVLSLSPWSFPHTSERVFSRNPSRSGGGFFQRCSAAITLCKCGEFVLFMCGEKCARDFGPRSKTRTGVSPAGKIIDTHAPRKKEGDRAYAP